MKKIIIPALLLMIVIMASCEKEIDFKIPSVESKVVIEGWIEQGQHPVVIVTRSAPYFDPVDSATLVNSIVMNAKVTVKDDFDGTSEQLVLSANPNIYPIIMYQGVSSSLTGKEGRSYTLTVEVDGKTYTSQTTIPHVLYLDSTWFAVEAGKADLGYCYGRGQDDGSTVDFYRMYTKRINKDSTFIPIWGSVWDDKFFNGVDFTFLMPRGNASNIMSGGNEDRDEFGYFKVGDVVISKLCHIDQNSYKFWSAAESEIFSGGNPFTSTTNIPTNIEGGALGVWWGLAASYDTIVCKAN